MTQAQVPLRRIVSPSEEVAESVYIGRGSVFSNPWADSWTYKDDTDANFVTTRQQSIENYRDWLLGSKFEDLLQEKRLAIIEKLPELRYQVLTCPCKSNPRSRCHGEILLELISELE